LTSENRPNTTNIIVSRQDVNLKCCFLLISMVVDRAHRFRIGTKSVGVEALGVDRKVRGKLVGWTGNEPENGGRGCKLSELKSD
jgi:hypothetical protein